MNVPLTLFEKVWNSHVITTRDDGTCLLWIDRHLLHEGSFHAFEKLDHTGRTVRRPDLTFGVADHYVPSQAGSGGQDRAIADPEAAVLVSQLRQNACRHGFDSMDMSDPRQGIVHVIAPEQGLTLPGLTPVCGDSHTATHGAFGALAFGIGASEVAHVLATQTLWQRKPAQMRVTIDGTLSPLVSAKDVILTIIAAIGAAGATGCAIEFAGSTIRAMSMAARMTLCNMSIEAGSRTGMIAPDETTFAALRGRPRAPKGAALDNAVAAWRLLFSDPTASFDRAVAFDASSVAPTVTWGTSPETALPITGHVPDPADEADPALAAGIRVQLEAMGLAPNQPLDGIAIDQVFIGSCTNGRIEDLRAAAAILSGRSAAIPGLVVAGSTPVKRQAEREGLHRIFQQAGLIGASRGVPPAPA